MKLNLNEFSAKWCEEFSDALKHARTFVCVDSQVKRHVSEVRRERRIFD